MAMICLVYFLQKQDKKLNNDELDRIISLTNHIKDMKDTVKRNHSDLDSYVYSTAWGNLPLYHFTMRGNKNLLSHATQGIINSHDTYLPDRVVGKYELAERVLATK